MGAMLLHLQTILRARLRDIQTDRQFFWKDRSLQCVMGLGWEGVAEMREAPKGATTPISAQREAEREEDGGTDQRDEDEEQHDRPTREHRRRQ